MKTRQLYLGKYQAGDHKVTSTGNGLICDCDFNGDCSHIKATLESLKQAEFGLRFKIMERSKYDLCPKCGSGDIKKWGMRKTKQGQVQTFKCNECKKRFTANFGFEKKQFDDTTITSAINMYHSKMSARRIADHLALMGISVSYKTIYNWASSYGNMTSQYVDGIVPHVGNQFRADEVWVKVAGHQRYLFASMDDDSRFWLASDMAANKFQHNAENLLRMTKVQAGKNPKHFITDGLPAYDKASRRIFGKNTRHIKHIHLAGKRDRDNNNKMERLNGEFRDREQCYRGLGKMDTGLIPGFKTYYNFVKKHSGIGGKTPAEAAGIIVEGKNKWRTLIQNAALNKIEA